MNKRLNYHADKMKWVCFLLAVAVAIVLISQIGSAVAKYSEYYEDPYYKADDIYDITQNVMEGVINSIIAYGLPLGVSIYIYVKGKDEKADPYKLFKIFVLTEVVLEIYQLIRSEVFSFSSPDIEDFMVFLFLLLPIAALPAGLYFLKIGKYKLFKVACVIFLVFPCIVWIQSNADFIEEITYIIEDLSGFEDINRMWLRIAALVLPVITVAAHALLLFKVFSPEPSIEEQLKKLNAELSAGTLDKEQYDEQRQKLLEKL